MIPFDGLNLFRFSEVLEVTQKLGISRGWMELIRVDLGFYRTYWHLLGCMYWDLGPIGIEWD